MQPFILWQKVEEPYIFGILSNLKKVQIGYINSYGEKVYYAVYYGYEDIADDYEPEVAPSSRQQQFTGAQWNRYQQRKHYKTLRENLNNSSNPEYTRPQQSSDIPFQPLQHSDKIKKGVGDMLRQAQEQQQAKDQEVLKGVIDFHDLRQRQRQAEKLKKARSGSLVSGMIFNIGFQKMTEADDYEIIVSPKLKRAKIDLKNIINDAYIVRANEIATELFNPY